MSAGPDEDAIAARLETVAAGYLGALDHVALASRVAGRMAAEYPEVIDELEALGLTPPGVAKVTALVSILTATTIAADVLEAAELEAAYHAGDPPASTIGDVTTDDGTPAT